MENSGGEDDDDLDGCLCGLELDENDPITSDMELPEVSGGVEIAVADPDPASEGLDGCDLDFNEGELTSDEELPPAAGGVG